MNSLKAKDVSLALFGHLISNANLLADTFRSISFSHVCCLGNSTTHNICKYAKHVTDFLIF